MPSLFAWLMAAAWPIVKKVLLMLGIGFITYESVNTLTDSVINSAQSAWGGMTGSALQIVSLAGMPEAMGIVAGAFAARAALVAVGHMGKVSS